MTEEKKKATNFWWPTLTTREEAIQASDAGMWVALVVAGITTVIATIAMMANSDIAGINPWAYLDAVLFAVIAWRIRARSRVFAVIGLALWLVEKAVQISDGTLVPGSAVMALLFTMFFVTGMRGTFAYHRLQDAPAT